MHTIESTNRPVQRNLLQRKMPVHRRAIESPTLYPSPSPSLERVESGGASPTLTKTRISPKGRDSPFVPLLKKREKGFKSFCKRLKSHVQAFAIAFVVCYVSLHVLKIVLSRAFARDLVPKLALNPIYTVPHSNGYVGDRSDRYVTLRKEVDETLQDATFFETHLASILNQKQVFQSKPMLDDGTPVLYDIHNCPPVPPPGYPYAWKTREILQHWHPDTTEAPDSIYQSLCIFDYARDFAKAMTYRKAAVPYILQNDPAVHQTVARWNLPSYMDRLLGNIQYRVEESTSNHFLFHLPPELQDPLEAAAPPKDWHPPTRSLRMTYPEWLSHANVPDASSQPTDPHWYFRLIGCGAMANDGSCDDGASEFLFDELPYLQPRLNSTYLVEPLQQEGLHCRFGMRGVMAENHYDAGRNTIVVLKGQRWYILSHPDQCRHLALYPKGHPSARHSAVDWSSPNDLHQYPQFAQATSTEVVLQSGDVLFLPAYWFHYIVSLDVNYQCNTRSGNDVRLHSFVRPCGF